MKLLVRKLFNKFGYDIVKMDYIYKRGNLKTESLIKEYKWLIDYNFGTIIDIGANEGQFSDKIRTLFPNALIYAFEPLPLSFERLKKNFTGDVNFSAFQTALGAQDGEIKFFENQYSQSSSVLSPSEELSSNFSFTAESKEINVKMTSLEKIMMDQSILFPLLVKIDVQGYEDHVIKGGFSILKNATVIICEVSFVELYKNQTLFSGIFYQLKELGFNYSGVLEQIRSAETNRILQADAVFIKTNESVSVCL